MMTPKFRAWDEERDEYFEVRSLSFLVSSNDKLGVVATAGGQAAYGPNMILEQFTSLKDANGKEIYVGDIVEATIEGCIQDEKYLVKNMWDPHVWTEESDSYYAVSKMEVKGNVHTNPELLEA